MIRLHRIRGRFYFVLLDSQGEGLPVIDHRRAYRRSIFRLPRGVA